MIRVKIEREPETRNIRSFRIEGHAAFEEAGKDIVCAGVSAVTVGTVNALEKVLGVSLPTDIRTGRLSAAIPELEDSELSAHVQMLLESMIVMLETIRQPYAEYISISDKEISKARRKSPC